MYNGKLLLIAVATSLAVIVQGTTPTGEETNPGVPAENQVIVQFRKDVAPIAKAAVDGAGEKRVDDLKNVEELRARTTHMTNRGWFGRARYMDIAIDKLQKVHTKAAKDAKGDAATVAKLDELRDDVEERLRELMYDDAVIKFQEEVNDIVVDTCGKGLQDNVVPAATDTDATDAGALLKERRRLAIALVQEANARLQTLFDDAVSKVQERDGADGKVKVKAVVSQRQMQAALTTARNDLDALVPAHPDVTEFQAVADKIVGKAEADAKTEAPIVKAAQGELEAAYRQAVEAFEDGNDAAAKNDLDNAMETARKVLGRLLSNAGAEPPKKEPQTNTARAEPPKKEPQTNTARAEPPKKEPQTNTARAEPPKKEPQTNTARAEPPKKEPQTNTARAEPPKQTNTGAEPQKQTNAVAEPQTRDSKTSAVAAPTTTVAFSSAVTAVLVAAVVV
ncbi:Uncharacterized protein PBTT_03986 [Plasmodiophora brassicae]